MANVYLKDGTVRTGQLVQRDRKYVVLSENGTETAYPVRRVIAVETL